MDDTLPVNRSMLETTLLATFWKPDTMLPAKAAPGKVGMVGALPPPPTLGADVVDAGIVPPPPLLTGPAETTHGL
jgi:hypothetical protein